MEILKEEIDLSLIETSILEEGEEGSKIKNTYISGVFLQGNTKNGNGRIYPVDVLSREVTKLYESKIKHNRLIGELDHPSTNSINLDRVSHIIKELKMDGDYAYGKAMIIDTPMGKIAKSLVEAGVKLGVSSRGLGSVKNGVVQNDLSLKTIDIVADPSAPDAFVECIMENKEWIIENGILVEKLNVSKFDENTFFFVVNENSNSQNYFSIYGDVDNHCYFTSLSKDEANDKAEEMNNQLKENKNKVYENSIVNEEIQKLKDTFSKEQTNLLEEIKKIQSILAEQNSTISTNKENTKTNIVEENSNEENFKTNIVEENSGVNNVNEMDINSLIAKVNELQEKIDDINKIDKNVQINNKVVIENINNIDQELQSDVNKIIVENKFSIQDRKTAFTKLFQETINKIKNKI